MGWCSILEGINVLLDGLNWDLVMLSSLGKELWVMDSLGSTGDLFSSHEEVVGVSVVLIMRVKHGVEGSSIGGIPIEHVEISMILLPHQLA
jgi:hypothetical protein